MLEKLLVVLLSGAVVAVSGVSVAASVAQTQPSPEPSAPTAAAIDEPAVPAVGVHVPDEDDATDTDERPGDARRGRAVRTPAPPSCATELQARTDAHQKVAAAFARLQGALEELRGVRPAATLTQAAEMLRQIAEKADRAITEIGECREGDVSEPVDQDGEDLGQVGDRAVAAMETVYNLAKSAALAPPPPTALEKPKATSKPTPKATSKPAKTPSCDDRIYEAKKALAASFDRFHSQNDVLWKQAEKTASPAFTTVKSADKVLHATYDSTKAAILKAGCADGAAMKLARGAADAFERTYLAARSAMESSARR